MKNEYKLVPVKAGQEIADKYRKDEVIILSIDRTVNKVDITTYGKNKKYCKWAAITGEFLAEVLEIDKPQKFEEIIDQMKEAYYKKRKK